ncbi:MAG: hypothetical protein JWO06_1738, partial [Bacteroidota bacterium]|nr:hypothetical protein [Bacteroidota bacterium]
LEIGETGIIKGLEELLQSVNDI